MRSHSLPRRLTGPRALLALTLLALAAPGPDASADMLLFAMPTHVNGDLPLGSLSATVTDLGPNQVRVTMTGNLTAPGEFIGDWAFNLAPGFSDFAHLSYQPPTLAGGVTAADSVTVGRHAFGFNPASLGAFDIGFEWSGSNHSFGGTDSVSYVFAYTGSTDTFTALSFDAVNSGGTQGAIYTAAKVQGIPPEGSGELGNTAGPLVSGAVPEPASLALMAIGGGASVAGYRLRRGRTA